VALGPTLWEFRLKLADPSADSPNRSCPTRSMHQRHSQEGVNQTVGTTLLPLIIPAIALALITIGERLKKVVPDEEVLVTHKARQAANLSVGESKVAGILLATTSGALLA